MKIIGNKRDRQWTRYMETGNSSHHKKFCRLRNKVKHLSKINRKQFEHTLAISAKENPKAIWKYINSRLKINKEITEIHIDFNCIESNLLEDMSDITNIFLQFSLWTHIFHCQL